MTVLPIVKWPEEVLQTACEDVEVVSAEVRDLARDMLETMYDAPGRGLAAPQVGRSLNLFVMDVDWKDGTPHPEVFANPRVISVGDASTTMAEGCLSLPGVLVDVIRPEAVELRWTALDGSAQTRWFNGFAAACVQHEVDHLRGVMTLDRVDDETRARVLSNYSEVSA